MVGKNSKSIYVRTRNGYSIVYTDSGKKISEVFLHEMVRSRKVSKIKINCCSVVIEVYDSLSYIM